MGLRRDQLAQRVNVRPDVIAAIETGKGTHPAEALILRLERALSATLPRR